LGYGSRQSDNIDILIRCFDVHFLYLESLLAGLPRLRFQKTHLSNMGFLLKRLALIYFCLIRFQEKSELRNLQSRLFMA